MRAQICLAVAILALLSMPLRHPGAAGEDERALAVVATTAGPSIMRDTKNNWGIFIGINEFEAKEVAGLRFCVADARQLHGALTGEFALIPPSQSYLLISGEDGKSIPDRRNILKTVQYVCRQAKEDSLIVISISTHGFTGADGKAYVLPVDGDPELLAHTAVEVETINDYLQASAATKKILIVDACREDTARGQKGGGAALMTEEFQNSLKAGAGQITLASCGPSQVSYENDQQGHGVFTYYLIKGLQGEAPPNHKGYITLWTLFQYANDQTKEWCKVNLREEQTPWMSGEISTDIPLAVYGRYETNKMKVEVAATVTMKPTPGPAVVATPRPTPQPTPRPTPKPTPKPGLSARLDPSKNYTEDLEGGVQIEMIYLPGGTFTIGTSNDWANTLASAYSTRVSAFLSEQPAHEVTIDPFWISKYEITNDQYRRYQPRHTSGVYSRSFRADLNGDKQPVVNVPWEMAKKYADWLAARSGQKYDLPTEAQWEFAAQG
ncbi:SUMF1/EgtB/PvdO family nonheme iron enzyme, partial [bacterium]|nr:SUMF1/EgtB/PvdO family nonheme iron enzyme [bacterium]